MFVVLLHLTMWTSLFIIMLLLNTVTGIRSEPHGKFLKLYNVDTKLISNIPPNRTGTIGRCCALCILVDWCFYVSYHEDDHLCNIHGGNSTGVTSLGWGIYFKLLDEKGTTDLNLMNGAIASQSSTYSFEGFEFSAHLALDNNTDGQEIGHSCAIMTDSYAYWMMQFGMPGVVDKIDIYLRSDFIDRNSNRIVSVAQTSDDEVGTECGRYVGPLIDTYPFMLTINCTGPIFGKFLRITYTKDDHSDVCEVLVYRP